MQAGEVAGHPALLRATHSGATAEAARGPAARTDCAFLGSTDPGCLFFDGGSYSASAPLLGVHTNMNRKNPVLCMLMCSNDYSYISFDGSRYCARVRAASQRASASKCC